jgi:D-amino-acid dehydrogenase
MAQQHVVVIGGGVIGAACAYHLVRDGWQVTLLEKDQFGRGCSHANCGLVCPSHVLPLAEPGAIRRTLYAMFRRNSPFAIKPRLDPALWMWLLRFARRCNRRDMLVAGKACQRLLEPSLGMYDEMIRSERMDCQWERKGLLFVFRTPQEMEAYARTDRLLGEEFNLPAKRIEPQVLLDLEPALLDGLAGGWYYPDDAHLRPDRLMTEWRTVLERHGVVIREESPARGIAKQNGRATSVQTDDGPLVADAFVLATGALAPKLSRELGCTIPIQPGKGYSVTMPRPAICPAMPLLFPEDKVVVTPMQSGYRLGSTMEFAGYDATIHRARLGLLIDGARRYLREPLAEPIQEEWFGWRPMTYDGIPIIDRTPAMRNVVVAAGHNMLGLSMAPATGRLVAEMLGDRSPSIDPAPYSLRRF